MEYGWQGRHQQNKFLTCLGSPSVQLDWTDIQETTISFCIPNMRRHSLVQSTLKVLQFEPNKIDTDPRVTRALSILHSGIFQTHGVGRSSKYHHPLATPLLEVGFQSRSHETREYESQHGLSNYARNNLLSVGLRCTANIHLRENIVGRANLDIHHDFQLSINQIPHSSHSQWYPGTHHDIGILVLVLRTLLGITINQT